MNQKIAISLINIPIIPTLDELDFAESSYIFGEGIIEIKNITNGGHRSAKDILTYIIPALIFEGVLDISNPIIHLRISGDGRNVGRKIKQVMITMAILNDEQNIHKPDHHYTTILFPGIESYELLEVMMSPFIQELNDLKNYGLKINNIIWKFELYFSSDWKFLSICLGFNAANSNYFCPWCQISKHDQINNQTNWKISKKMEKINEYPGHSKKPLFNMISLDHWIPDELHIMLRIFDRLWSLVLSELKDVDQFDNICHNEIVQEMNRIGVHFQFWEENGSNTWNYTSLMGNDKLKVLKDFDLDYDPHQFQFEAEDWLELFLTPDRVIPNSNRIEKGLYSPSAITPYIHVLVQSFKGGGSKHKSVIKDILEYESRSLFYLFDYVVTSTPKPKKLIFFKDYVVFIVVTDSWGQVLEISFKTQHKYQSVWTKMILKPTVDTDFVMRTWQQKLGDGLVRWYPGHWKLREHKAWEHFQVKFSLLEDWKSNPLAFSYHNNQSFEHTLSHKLKGHAFIHLKVHGICQLIAYFETHEHLLRCMEFKHHWKLTISTPPTKKIPQKSKKDKKPYSQQSKGKNLGKSLSSLTRSCNKSNTQQKTEDTRSLLLKLLNLLVKSVALISFVGPKKAVNWCLRSRRGCKMLTISFLVLFYNSIIYSQYACRGILCTSIWTLKSQVGKNFDMDLVKLQIGKKHFALRYRPYWKKIPWTSEFFGCVS
ncbi:hypothetical protein GLOIN_2v1839566 [Rhizophagus irregularis DAOM 181602=DAOM 197198]|nr:hypothetical protein GLOIN_2v1839566 [Rhizophagus irregularis DAOM 181602=DAOM 197198]